MASVTVPGTGGSAISQAFDNQSNQALAQQISDALAAASQAGGLKITTEAGGVVPAPPSNPGGINELLITSGGSINIPAGSTGNPDYVVILENTLPVTIVGGPNNTIFGGSAQVTVIDPEVVTLAEGAGNAITNLTSPGAVVAGNNANDQLAAFGAGESIAGGTGANNMFALGTGDTISSSGSQDTLSGGTSSATFMTTGTNTLVFMPAGGGTVIDTGMRSTIVGGDNAANVTMGGSQGVLFGRAGTMSVVDSGPELPS